MVSGKCPVRYAFASASSRSSTRSRRSRQNSSTISRSAWPVVSARVLVCATNWPLCFRRLHVGRRRVREAPLDAQHAVQPVGPRPAEDLDQQVHGDVVVGLPRNAELAHPDLGLHRTGPVDHHHPPGGVGRPRRRGRGHLVPRPVAEGLGHGGHRLVDADVAHDGQQRVVRREVGAMEVQQVLARHSLHGLHRAVAGRAVRMDTVDQAVEHQRRRGTRDPRGSPSAPTGSAGAGARAPPARRPGCAGRRRPAAFPARRSSFITTTLTKDRSRPRPVLSSPPAPSIVSATCCAERVAVPWSSSVDTIAATPGFPAGSWAPPACTRARRLTAGCSRCTTTTTWRPFGSVRTSYGGNCTSLAASGRGGPLDGHFGGLGEARGGGQGDRDEQHRTAQKLRGVIATAPAGQHTQDQPGRPA